MKQIPVTASNESERYGLSPEHWAHVSERERALYRTINPLRRAAYAVDQHVGLLQEALARMATAQESLGGKLDLQPDFQRGHVWSRDKQVAFVGNLIRGSAPATLRFNCPGWTGRNKPGDLPPADMVCVDGLQRLTAIRAFLAGEFTVFGETAQSLDRTAFDLNRRMVTFEVFDIAWRADLLAFYLDINSGGVNHTAEDLDRVRAMLAQTPPPPQVTDTSTAPARRRP